MDNTLFILLPKITVSFAKKLKDMNFWYKVIEDGFHNYYFSRVSEEYDGDRKKHVFFYDYGREEGIKEIFTIDPLTEEIEWVKTVDEALKNDDEIKCAIRDFKKDTIFLQGDKNKAKKWLFEKLCEWVDIGFNNEILISVNGKSIDSDKVYWIIKRIVSFTVDAETVSEPVIAVRNMDYPISNDLKPRQKYRESDLYVNEKGEFKPKEIFEAIWKDINLLEIEIFNITVEYHKREGYGGYL